MDVIFWGAGRFWKDFSAEIEYAKQYTKDNWLAIYDKDPCKTGKTLLGFSVEQPKYRDDVTFIITSKFYDEIKQWLQGQWNVPDERIIGFSEYYREMYAKIQYKKLYKEDDKKKNIFNLKDIAIYTCITGDYDELVDPLYCDNNIDYICFTNNKNIRSRKWHVQYIENENIENVYLARYVKMFPDIYLKKYETSIWVDAKYTIRNDLRKYVEQYGKDKPMLCFPHPERDNIYDEGKACIRYGRGKAEEIEIQMKHYKEMGYLGDRLFDSGCIVRNHHDENVKKLMKSWWYELQEFSYRDQISLPYVLWKNNYDVDICDLDINNNKWLKMSRKL